MEIYHDLDNFKKPHFAVVTSGTFDGVHEGHLKILKRLIEIAKKNNGETVLFTFWPHPRMVLYPHEVSLKLLSTQEEKVNLLRIIGIDRLVIMPFTKAFSEQSSIEFVTNVLAEKIGTKILVIGYNHRFGKNREGSFEYLKKNSGNFGFAVEEIPAQELENINVSSTKIREALLDGHVSTANKFLGREYSIAGKVTEGQKLGKKIGFPTANIHIEEDYKLIPADGVYAVKVVIEGIKYSGMMNIGFRPTVNGTKRTVEVNIFDFDQNLYGKTITILFIEMLRKEIRFGSLEELKQQIKKDEDMARNMLVR